MKRRWLLLLTAAFALLFTLNASAAEAPTGERIIYGTSGEGRVLEAYRYGSGENVLIMGFAIHGFEDNFDRDGEALVYTAKQVMAHLEGSYLPDTHNWTVYILPCMNPDGLYSGWTMDGPGRCTTTYLSGGKLISGKGIDMNRCFPTNFSPKFNDRNYTTSVSMACLEAQALSDFIQDVKGSKVNVLIDVHGWYEQSITTSTRISTAFNKNFPSNTRTNSNGGSGYLMAYAHALGYESGLLELPAGIYSLSQYKYSTCVAKVIACVEDLIRSEPNICSQRGHNYVTETVKATCTGSGRKIQTCKACGHTVTTAIAATGHSWNKGKITTAPTCAKAGVKTYTCSACGTTKTESVAATGSHTWNKGKVTTAPTCVKKGVKAYTCSVCGTTKTESVAATGHTWTSEITTAPTCTGEGIRTYTCTVCGTVKAEAVAPLGHSADPDTCIPVVWPTASKDGVYTYACTRCGETGLNGVLDRVFTDASSDAYYSDPLDWCFDRAYISGTGSNTFSPNMTLNRAMLVTILYRYHGSPEVSGEIPFNDVPEDVFYTDPVKWASQNGIINGISDSLFAPNDPVAREQAMAIFFRYVCYLGKDNGLRALEGFSDLDRLNDYAVEAAAWSVANGIIQGTDQGMLMPLSPAIRAQSVTILWRLDEYLKNVTVN